jgi:DNA-binding transcriptional MerR regulator
MSTPTFNTRYTLMLVRSTETGRATYSLETAARMADVHPEMLRYYCQLGLFGSALARPEAELIFDDDALYELRRFEHYRRHQGVSRKTLRLLCGLWREVERLQNEIRFLRSQ